MRRKPVSAAEWDRLHATTQGRVLLCVRYRPRTVSEVARELELDVLDVLRAVLVLEEEGEVERTCERRRGEVVLRCAKSLMPQMSAIEAQLAESLS